MNWLNFLSVVGIILCGAFLLFSLVYICIYSINYLCKKETIEECLIEDIV